MEERKRREGAKVEKTERGTPTHDYNNNSSRLPVSQQTEPGNRISPRMRKSHCELIISINIPHHSQMWANSDSCQVHAVHNSQTVTWYQWRSNVTYRHVRGDTANSLLTFHVYYHNVMIYVIYEWGWICLKHVLYNQFIIIYQMHMVIYHKNMHYINVILSQVDMLYYTNVMFPKKAHFWYTYLVNSLYRSPVIKYRLTLLCFVFKKISLFYIFTVN